MLTYRSAVSKPTYVTLERNGSCIVYGGAREERQPNTVSDNVCINFMDGCKEFPEHKGARSLTIYLPQSRIQAYRGGALLMKRLELAQAANYYLKVYCWGTIKPRNQQPGYIVEIDSLDNLVIKVVSKQRNS